MRALAILVLALALVTSVAPAGAAAFDEKAVADFYRGKTVRIIVGFAAGGGFDAYSRAIGRHIGRHIPGAPTVIVDNMPGVGGVIAANHVFNVAPRDGTLIGNVGGPIIIEQALGSPGIQFDMAKFRYLAVPASESYLMIATRKAGFTRFGELLGSGSRQIVVGGIPGSTVEHAGLLLRDVLGANVRVVSGYKGTSEIRLAMEGGEVQGLFNTWASLKVTSFDRFKSGEWPILLQLTDTPIPDLPVARVPTINDVTQNEEQRQLLRFGTHTPNLFGKVYVLPPGVPADRAQALETAFARTFADKEFLAEAEKARLEIAPLTAEQVSKLVGEFLGMSPDLKAKLQRTLGKKR